MLVELEEREIEAETERETADALGKVAAALDELLALDADWLGGDELAGMLVALSRQQARLGAAAARLTAAFDARQAWADDGCRSCATWLGYRCHVPPKQAHATLRLGRRLRTMPQTEAALCAGDIGVAQAQRLADLNSGRTAAAFGESEAQLVEHARTPARSIGSISLGPAPTGSSSRIPTGSRPTPPTTSPSGACTCPRG
jgi:hypothetical protein